MAHAARKTDHRPIAGDAALQRASPRARLPVLGCDGHSPVPGLMGQLQASQSHFFSAYGDQSQQTAWWSGFWRVCVIFKRMTSCSRADSPHTTGVRLQRPPFTCSGGQDMLHASRMHHTGAWVWGFCQATSCCRLGYDQHHIWFCTVSIPTLTSPSQLQQLSRIG